MLDAKAKAKLLSLFHAGSKVHAMVAAALQVEIDAPRFHGRATLTSDGHIMCNFEGRDGEFHMGAHAGHIETLRDFIEHGLEHGKLTATQYARIRNALCAWLRLPGDTKQI